MQDITLETAIAALIDRVHAPRMEELPLLSLPGRVAAEDVFAQMDNPPFDRSPLDGYAVRSADTTGVTADRPLELRIMGEECAGAFFEEAVPAGCCVRVMTGAAMPEGTDAVVRQEDVTLSPDGQSISLPYALGHHENYCFAGEDVKQGVRLVEKGSRYRASAVAVLASQGYEKASVYVRPRVALASTGDELTAPGTALAPGKIYNSNLYLVAGRMKELGLSPVILGILPDDPAKAAHVLREVEADILLTTGGVSVGKKDIMHQVVPALGAERIFWRVCMKPGAPAIGYGLPDGRLGLALSGNPFAAFATFEILARPLLRAMEGCRVTALPRRQVVLRDSFPKESRGRRFIRARVEGETATLPDQHASGTLFSAVGCNAFLDIPAGTGPLPVGAEAEAVLLMDYD